MAKFKYRMQNILELKMKLEEQQKMDLAAARINLNEEEDKLKDLYERKNEYQEALRESCKNKLNVHKIRMSTLAYESMDDVISRQKIEVKKARGKVAIEQDKMGEAMKERKIQEAEGQAKAIRAVKEAEAEGIRLIREAGADEAVLRLRGLDALTRVADGRATKIVIPSDIQNMAGLVTALKETASVATPGDGSEKKA